MTSSVNDYKSWSKWHERLHKSLKNNSTMLPSGSSILLSVSGGQDSMAMVKLILDLQRIYNWKIHIWHGDHGWHQESKKVSNELESWCQKHEIPFFCGRTTLERVKTESQAREWRYENLINQAKILSTKTPSQPCKYILTGHTGSDRAETFIMNLARGANIAGLSSLKESRELTNEIKLIRPMLNFQREETIRICNEMCLPIWIDPSNSNLNFTRNRVRKEILPVLENLHPGSTMRISNLSESLSHLNNNQNELTSLAIEALYIEKGLSREKITKLSLSTRATIFSKWIKDNNAPMISSIKLLELSRKVSFGKPPGLIELSKAFQIQWNKHSINLTKT